MPKDNFTRQAAGYAQFRPSYPEELIQYILQFVKNRDSAWDCATGNGQVAILLSPHFKTIKATDLSKGQLQRAVAAANIEYSLAEAGVTHFPDSSFDLITVAQAYHWLNIENFSKEANRVGKPGAIVAIWGYNIPTCEFAAINELILDFYSNKVGPCWDYERRHVEKEYRSLNFPFEELPAKHFGYSVEWSENDLMGYLNTWSAVQHFIDKYQYNPVDEEKEHIGSAWPASHGMITFTFPLFLRLGSIEK